MHCDILQASSQPLRTLRPRDIVKSGNCRQTNIKHPLVIHVNF